MTESVPEQPHCPFAEGDRVDHAKFGLGTISNVEQGAGRSASDPAPKWKVEVVFDLHPIPKRLVHSFLTKVGSPEERPFIFWDKQWRALRQAWLDARRDHEAALSTFRPAPAKRELELLRARENAALVALETFIVQDSERLSAG